MTCIEGQVLTPRGFRAARVLIESGRIRAVDEASDVPDRLVLPGFIDLHCHGGGGRDLMDAGIRREPWREPTRAPERRPFWPLP